MGLRSGAVAIAALAAGFIWTTGSAAEPAVADAALPAMKVTSPPEVLSDRATPLVCLRFDAALAPRQAAALESYVESPDASRLAARVRDGALCVEGLSHGGKRRIVVKTGLRGAGAVVRRDQVVEVDIPDRAPRITFASSGSILPRLDATGLPLETVNVDQVRLLLVRVSDADVIEQLREGHIATQVSYDSVGRVTSKIGRNIWSGILEVDGRRNEARRTAVPIREVMPEAAPGVYLAVAEDPEHGEGYSYWATAQWFMVSDIGLTAFRGQDGLTVLARSVGRSAPLEGVQLRLIAEDGSTLAQSSTRADGLARLDAGYLRGEEEKQPRAFYAYGEAGDFVYLDLQRSPLDLTDRGVGGRTAPGVLDAFVATERGIYRPGESVHLTALLRSDRSVAVTGLPLTLSVRRHDGLEVVRRTLPDRGAGGYETTVALPANAATGQWQATVHAEPEGPPLGRTSFAVEDFVPPRIEMALAAARRAGIVEARVQADYLYGAPAAELGGEVTQIIRPAVRPHPDFADYQFGLAEEEGPDALQRAPASFSTNAAGEAVVRLPVGKLPATSRPLEAVLRASVFDVGGRPISRAEAVPLRNLPLMIGIDPGFDGDGIGEGETASFRLIALDREGQRVARELDVRIVREEVEYIWYRRGGLWDYEVYRRDAGTVLDERVAVPADAPATVRHAFDGWGQFRIEARDPATGTASSVRFHAGWWGAAAGTGERAPDRVALEVAPGSHRPGDTVQVKVEPPFDADLQLTLADTAVRSSFRAPAGTEGREISVELPDDGAAGVYLLVNAFGRPDGVRSQAPRRAIGTLWIPYDPAPKRLDVAIDAPAAAEPGQRLEAVVGVAGAEAGERAHLTLAAVDDGVLQLTGFGAPDPVQHFLGKRRLGLDVFDLYGEFIDAAGATLGRVRSGGDMAALSGTAQLSNLPGKSEPVVALFSGIVEAGADGRVRVPLELPDFDGRLRLMAQAWTKSRVGKGVAVTTVRRPVVGTLALPRFLSPGDNAEITVGLSNLAGPAGEYSARVSASGPLSVAEDAGLSGRLEPGGRSLQRWITLAADGVGEGEVVLHVTGPNGIAFERRRRLDVRSPNAVVTRRYLTDLAPGQTLAADPSLADGLYPATARLSIGVNPLPDLDLPSMLIGLRRYPYGCAEQTVSTSFPLLYMSGLMQGLDMRLPRAPEEAVASGVERLLGMQTYGGGFGFWSSDEEASPWLTAYAADFLVRAERQGIAVPAERRDAALERLREIAEHSLQGGDPGFAAGAYATYVRALAGIADPGQVRRFADVAAARVESPLAEAQLAAALALIGDPAGAGEAFARFRSQAEADDWRYGDYGSAMRDEAGVLALMAESGVVAWTTLAARAEALSNRIAAARWLSTQEQAWIVRAGHALMSRPGPPVTVGFGEAKIELAAGRPFYRASDVAAAAALPRLRNDSAETIYGVVSVVGTPREAPPATDNGFRVERALLDRRGHPIDLRAIEQNDLVVVVLSGTYGGHDRARALLVDYLPAGFEIENAALGGADARDYPWLGRLTETEHEERRDDRFVAAFDIDGRDGEAARSFRVAYLARAVTPGRFAYGGAYVEDMYRPEVFGLGEAEHISVAAPPTTSDGD